MTLLYVAVDEKKLDVRVLEKNLSTGVLSSADVEKAQQQLPDDSENADFVSLQSLIDDESSSG